MIRAVIDTNVLVSGMLSPSGNEAMVLLALDHRLIRACFSPDILAEYAAVLARPKFAFPPEEIDALLAMLRSNGELFRPVESSLVSPDPGDTKILHCALAAEADYIVTGNRRHFPDAPYGSIQVVSARELLDQITLGL